MKKIFNKYNVDKQGNVYNLDGRPRLTDKYGIYVIKETKLYRVSKLRAYSMAYLGAKIDDIIDYNGGKFSSKNINIHPVDEFENVFGYEHYLVNKNGLIVRKKTLNVINHIKYYDNVRVALSKSINTNSKVIIPMYEIMLTTFIFKKDIDTAINIKYFDNDFSNVSLSNINYQIIPSVRIKGSKYFLGENNKVYNNQFKEVKKTKFGYNIYIDSNCHVLTLDQIKQCVENKIDIAEVFEQNKKIGCLEALKLNMDDVYSCNRVFESAIYNKEIKTWSKSNVKTFKKHLETLKSLVKKPLSEIKMWEFKQLRKQVNK